MAHAIFISYRRDDTGGEAGRLYDDLTRAFGSDAVFMDVSGIEPGVDFRKVIDGNVGGCGVLLAMIGPAWATIAGSDGQRRLDNENDYVRLEISAALRRNVAVIPVLVHSARMVHAEQLPDNLKDLAYRNSVELTLARWPSDVQLLIQALGQYVHADAATEATIPAQLPPPHSQDVTALDAPAVAKSKMPLFAGIGVAALVAALVVVFFVMRGSALPSDPASSSGPAENTNAAVNQASAAAPVAATPTGTPVANPLAGRWTNPDANARGSIVELDISGHGSQLPVHAWGLCRPAKCDWGTQTASFDGEKAKATWSMLNDASGEEMGRVATVTISSGGAGKLEVLVENTYARRAGNTHRFEFVPAQ